MLDSPLCFVHIPKTAGSSLRWLLDRQHRRFLYLIAPWFAANSETPAQAYGRTARRPDAVGAHRPWRSDTWPGGTPIAMLRDPVKRVLSHVAHVRSEPRMWMPGPQPPPDLPLADWIERQPLALFDNEQVRYLSGAAEFDGMPLTTAMTEADLETALTAVRQTVLAAPMDRFDEALLDWQHRLGWRPPYYRRVNVRRRRRDEVPERDREALEHWNRLDRILLREVDEVFRQRVAETELMQDRPMAEMVAAFRARNGHPATQARLLLHTLHRGARHPLRAARMVHRVARQRLSG